MTSVDPREELLGLVRGFRRSLEALGVYGVPAGASQRVALMKPGRGSAASAPEGEPAGASEEAGRAAGGMRLTLAEIRADLGDCTRCKLSAQRGRIVFGVGDPDAPLLFVGEAPGADEDRVGEPFVGRAGKLLDRMIAAMGWTRDTVYICNTVKCRPPKNRDPEPDEVAACRPFLEKQIESIGPRVIVTLGRPAAQLLLETRAPISALRGSWKSYRGIPVMPTFHPAFLLRSPERKRDAWSDLKHVIAELERVGVRPPHAPRA